QVSPNSSPPAQTTTTQVTLSGLFPGRMYYFAVAAANAAGWGPESLLASGPGPADWNGLAKRAAPFVYRVKFGTCHGDGCTMPIAAGYAIALPTAKGQMRCYGVVAPPDPTAQWMRLPCWTQPSNLFFV